MNRNLSKRVVRWLTIFSTTACIGGITLTSSVVQGQDSPANGNSSSYQWRAKTPPIVQASAMEKLPNVHDNVAHATGAVMPPIVSPEQAISASNSSMLAPIASESMRSTAGQPTVQNAPLASNAPVLGPISNSTPPIIASNNMPPIIASNNMLPIIASNSIDQPPILPAAMNSDGGFAPTGFPPTNSPPGAETTSPQTTQGYNQPTPDYFQSDVNAISGYELPQQNTCNVCGGVGCPVCGNAAPGVGQAGCNSCGPGGCFNQQDVDNKFGCCGSMACASNYVIFDLFAISRQDDRGFGGTNFGGLDNFDYATAFQLTFGRRFDATSGSEFTIFATDDINRSRETTSNTNSLNAVFLPGDGFGVAELGSFFGANRQIESQTTKLYSFEYNRVKWSWDVAKLFLGLRYVYTEDVYTLISQDNFGQGQLQLTANNNLIGPQIGGELFYDVGYRLSFSMLGKAGLFVNLGDLETNLVNNGIVAINQRKAADTDLSGTVDFGIVAHYQLSSKFRLRAGFQGMWLFGAFSANGNYPRTLGISSGGQISNRDDMTFAGVFGGFEYYR